MPIDTAKFYDQLLAIKIDLAFEDIPTPSYLQDKILECNDAMRAVEKMILETTRESSSREKTLKIEQMRLDVKRRSLLVNDPIIKKLPTGKEREAAADEALQKDHEAILVLSNDSLELQNLLSSIRLVHQNLKTTNSDIRTLMRIMEQQVFKLNVGSKDDKEVQELAAGLREAEQLDEEEISLDNVESTSESVDQEEPDSRSQDTPPTTEGTVSDEAGSDSGNELDGLSSFLSDDTEEIGGQTTTPDEDDNGNEEGSAQSAVGEEGAPQPTGSPKSTEATNNEGGGGSVVTGLDIDLGDILSDVQEKPVPIPDSKPVEKATSKVVKAEDKLKPAAAGAPPKAAPVKEEKKALGQELNIDDILNSLDM